MFSNRLLHKVAKLSESLIVNPAAYCLLLFENGEEFALSVESKNKPAQKVQNLRSLSPSQT